MMYTVLFALAVVNAQTSEPDVICQKQVVKAGDKEVARVNMKKGAGKRRILCNMPRPRKNQPIVWAKTHSKLECSAEGWGRMCSSVAQRMVKVCNSWREKVDRCPRFDVKGMAKVYRYHYGHSVGAVWCKNSTALGKKWIKSATTLKCGDKRWFLNGDVKKSENQLLEEACPCLIPYASCSGWVSDKNKPLECVKGYRMTLQFGETLKYWSVSYDTLTYTYKGQLTRMLYSMPVGEVCSPTQD